MLDEIEAHFADPPAVRWRREAQYLRDQDQKEKKKKKNPYNVVFFREEEEEENSLRKRERNVARRERLLAQRESNARIAADRAAAAQAAADAALAISRRLTAKFSKRNTAERRSPAPRRTMPLPKKSLPPRRKSASPGPRKTIKKSISFPAPQRRLPAWPGPSRPLIEEALPSSAVDEFQRLGADLVEIDDESLLRVSWRRRRRVRIRLVRFDYDMCLTSDDADDDAKSFCEWPAKELVRDNFATAILLDSDDVGPLVTAVEMGRAIAPNDTNGLVFAELSGRRLRVFDSRREEIADERGDLVRDDKKCFAEHVFETGRGRCLVGALFRRRDTNRIVFKPIAIRLPFSESPWQDVEHCCRALASARVQPYCLVDIEHCCNCEKHETTTKHVPGSYETKAEKLEEFLKRNFCVVVSRRSHPRLGAFEVRCQSYTATKPVLLFSKFGSGRFPDHEEVAETFSAETAAKTLLSGREETKRKVVVHVTDRLGYGAPGALVYLLSPTPCSFPSQQDKVEDEMKSDDEEDGRRVSCCPRRSTKGALGPEASALRSWNRKDVRAWLGTVGGLSEDEVAGMVGRTVRSGVDLLTLSQQDHRQQRRKSAVLMDGLRTLPPCSKRRVKEEGPRADSAWEVLGVARCDRFGRCQFETSRSRFVAAHYGSEFYEASSTPLPTATKTNLLGLELEPVLVELKVVGGDVELISTRRRGMRIRARDGIAIAATADIYVMSAGWRLIELKEKVTLVEVTKTEAERASWLRRTLASAKIQRRFRRSQMLVDIVDEYI